MTKREYIGEVNAGLASAACDVGGISRRGVTIGGRMVIKVSYSPDILAFIVRCYRDGCTPDKTVALIKNYRRGGYN